MVFENSTGFAEKLDREDILREFRKEFHFPQHQSENAVYLTGNSLGLMPIKGEKAILQELNDWKKYGVDGHVHAKNPWLSYHEMFKEPLAKILGAKAVEVTAMNGLTTNLHLLMASFYQPEGKRFKILCEAKAFPSDQYALESQVKFHGYDPEEAIVEVFPREGEYCINHQDILDAIEKHKDSLALIMIGGANYYTGQIFNMEDITRAGHEAGSKVGFDLAHAAGNVKLELHKWEVDFAAWCSYKYLNSGPGSVAGIFVHEKHAKNSSLKRFAGWWGTPPEDRFLMKKGFMPDEGADGWQLSNAPVLSMAIHKVALDLHLKAGIDRLLEKQKKLTAYAEFILDGLSNSLQTCDFEIITPKSPNERGSQLSILSIGFGKKMFDQLIQNGVIADWREPNVIRIAPVPLYNSFQDVYRFGQVMEKILTD